jgi:hypothetical protein
MEKKDLSIKRPKFGKKVLLTHCYKFLSGSHRLSKALPFPGAFFLFLDINLQLAKIYSVMNTNRTKTYFSSYSYFWFTRQAGFGLSRILERR